MLHNKRYHTVNVQVVSSLLAAPLVLPVLQWLGLRRLVVWTGAGGLALGAAVRCASLDGWDQQVYMYEMCP
jgi:hypothetical protein